LVTLYRGANGEAVQTDRQTDSGAACDARWRPLQ